MADEDVFLIYQERCLSREGNPALAHQVGVHQMERGRFNALHTERLVKLSKEPGFTACLVPGVSVSREHHMPAAEMEDTEMPDVSAVGIAVPPEEREVDIDPDADLDAEVLADAFEHIVTISHDT
ncbi:hypothetical protein B0H16DRAFT_1448486 [Mycena metata]|uniref:Uncharacterized protein n=1 Tax=Mycena metata TaxID=1033252 RepID=A0AAD7NXD5_9AGAR|nr:hypothetical protein B0H16DRAFT_1448486 [Mycena metata]